MDNPKVSVLLPVYNAERFLNYSLDSLFAQSFQDFEIVAIDDGSTDRSSSILRNYEDSRLRVFRNDQNIGLIRTLNKGIELCRGKYIARIDADDSALPHRLETQVGFLESNPDTFLVFSGRTSIDDSGNEIAIHNRVVTGDGLIRWKLLTGNFITHSSVVFRTSSIPKPLFDTKYLYAEDYAAWLLLLSEGKFESTIEPLVKYRFHGDSVSAQHRTTQVNSAMTALQSHLQRNYRIRFSVESLALWSSPEDANDYAKQSDFLELLHWMHPMNSHFEFFSGSKERAHALYHYYRRLTFLLVTHRARRELTFPIARAFLSFPFFRQ